MKSPLRLDEAGAAVITNIALATLLVPGCDLADRINEQSPANGADYRSEPPAPVDDENNLASYVAQCEAVLGKIPRISCDPANPAPGTRVTKIPVFYEGKLLGFDADLDPDEALELERREAEQDYSCDFPSIGGDFPCSIGSTLVQYYDEANPNVQWVGLCRGVGHDNPNYDRFIGNGLIGANEITGEMCFFFGGNPDTEAAYELPQLTSDAESNEELEPWLPPRDMPGSCLSCHPNNDPWILTPWLQPSYMAATLTHPDYPLSLPNDVTLEDTMAARFVVQTQTRHKLMLPEPLPPERTAWTEEEIVDGEGQVQRRQYRAVGSSYVSNEAEGGIRPRTGMTPPSWDIDFRERLLLQPNEVSCANGCHALGNEHFTELALDSLGNKFAQAYLSPLMKSRQATPGHLWMPLGAANTSSWQEMFDEGEPSIPAITECPIPKQVDDVPTLTLQCAEGDADHSITVKWTYHNDFGDVPGRDDVRFDVGLTYDGDPDEPFGVANSRLEGVKMEDNGTADVELFRDVAPANDRGSDYRFRVPVSADVETVLVDLQPKRYCFEEPYRRPFAYAPPHRVAVDVKKNCG